MLELLEHLQKELAVIEGAPISFAIAVAICFLIVSLLYRQRFAMLREELAEYRNALEAISPAQLARRIQIKDPADKGHVSRQFIATGTAKPLGSSVQILVFAGDGLWHPQERPRFTGIGWQARCWAGAEDEKIGAMFKIVAIDGTWPVSEPLDDLPSGVARSKVLTIYRDQ